MPASGLDFFYIIRPEATKNLHTNPSIETNTTTYSAANSSTLARVSTQQRRGSYSLSVTPTSHVDGGVNTGTFTVETGGFTASFDFLGVLGVNYYAQFLNSGATKIGSTVNFTGTGTWQRYELSHSGVTSVYLSIRKNNNSNTGAFFVDGILLENKIGYSTTYIDGDQDGGYWDALPHGSTSQRFANYRAGGQKINISTYNAYIIDMTGVGAAPVETSLVPYGSIPGALYQGTTVKDRTITIGVNVTGGNVVGSNTDDLQMWQINMESIFDLIKPNLVYPQQPFVLGYQHGNNDLEIDCVYANGMDLQNEKLKSTSDITFQLQCPSPYWRETYTRRSTAAQSPTEMGATDYLIYSRDLNALWTSLNPTATNSFLPYVLYIGPVDGKLYVGGDGTLINNVSCNGIGVYDFTTGLWSSLGTGVSGGTAVVHSITQLDNGDIIIGGNFTTANGVTTRCIARWNGTTFTIVGQANPFTGTPTISALEIDPTTRDVLVAGNFTAGGASGALTNYVARFACAGASGSTCVWEATTNFTIQTAGAVSVTDIEVYGKYVYIAGQFTSVGSGANILANSGFARYNSLSKLWETIGTGLAGSGAIGRFVTADINGGIYIAGDYTSISSVPVRGIAYWNGYTISSPLTTEVYETGGLQFVGMDYVKSSGTLLVCDNRSLYRIIEGRAVIDLMFMQSTLPPKFLPNDNNGTIILAPQGGYKPSTTTITNNGSADVNPIIRITAGYTVGLLPPAVFYIRNNTNGKSIYFNQYNVRAGGGDAAPLILNREVITIDCRPNGEGVYSSLREKEVPLDPVTQETDFFLCPGDNIIEVVSLDSTDASPLTIELFWRELHWSFFGGHV